MKDEGSIAVTAPRNRAQTDTDLVSRALKRSCPVCGNTSRQKCNRRCATPEFEVLRCRDCGVTFINEMVNNDFGFSIGPDEKPDPTHVLKAADDFKRLMVKFSALGITRRANPSLLDIGCGAGCFLKEAKQGGWKVAGLELSPSLAAYAQNEHGLQVQKASIESPVDFPSDSFDAITMYGVIEHLAHPRRGAQECARLLRSGGILVLQTPSEDGLIRRAGHFLYWVSGGFVNFQVNQLYQTDGGHSVCFNRRSMRRLLESSGFEVVAFEQSTYGFRVLLHRFKNLHFAKRIVQTIGTLIVFSVGSIVGGSNHMTVYARKTQN